jgi:hypothetical protein
MDDAHLTNAIAFCERQGALVLVGPLETDGEEDRFIALTQLKMLGFSALRFQRYENLLKEQKRREENKRIEEAEADGIDPIDGGDE